MDKFKISATGVSINYMPEYLAQKLGYFSDAGLEVSSYVPSPWTKVLTDIDSGEYQCVVGGVWAPLIYKNWIKNYSVFAKVASRCPLVLISREPVDVFDWRLLEDKVVLVSGGNGASPGLFLSGCADEGGADVTRIKFVNNFTAAMLFDCFKGGLGDMVLLKSDLASILVNSGCGHVAADLAVCGGIVPWSVYYTVPEVMEREDNITGRFTLALQRATDWLLSHDSAEVKDILAEKWPKVDIDSAVSMVDTFKNVGMWDETVCIKEDELMRWQGFLLKGNVINRRFAYDDIIDSRAYDYAKKQLNIQ